MAATITAVEAIQALKALAELAKALSSPSDTDKIIGAIKDLATQTQEGFTYLSDLIERQTQIIVDTINWIAAANALKDSDTALHQLDSFSRTKQEGYLQSAEEKSSEGIHFFLELAQMPRPDRQPGLEPYFLPGLAKAGTIRIGVVVLQDPNFLTSRPIDVSDIHLMIKYLGDMIDVVRQKVEEAHVVDWEEQRLPDRPGEPGPVLGGWYAHVKLVRDAKGKVTNHYTDVLHRYRGKEGFPRAEAARTLAESDRSAGVAHDLVSLGIPEFEAILQSWKTVVRA